MFRIEDAIYHINNKEYTFDSQKGSHAIYIRKDKQECQICDYKHCKSITEYSNYRDGKFHEVNTNTYELYFEDGDTLIISNDTLYGYSDNPILLKRK
ncbi:MAG: hypothetical protein MJZ15_11940 [Bacteroidales bacterium]|nr:hypothetical protein [Bacteroidales bacterium]